MKESDLQWLMLIESFTPCINLEFSSLSNVFSLPNSSNPCPNEFWSFYYCHSGLFSKTGPKITCTRVWTRVWCCDTRPGTRPGRGRHFLCSCGFWDACGHACGSLGRVWARVWESGTRLGTRLASRPQYFTSIRVWGRV